MPILGIYASSMQPALNASSYDSIATVTVGAGGSSSISFSSIPSTYKHLQIRGIARESSGSSTENIKVVLNSDTGSNYSTHLLYTTGGGSAYAYGAASTAYMFGGVIVNSGNTASVFGASVIDILDYANTNKYKTLRSLGGTDTNTSDSYISLFSGNWRSTSAVDTVTITAQTGNFVQYSTFALYGIK